MPKPICRANFSISKRIISKEGFGGGEVVAFFVILKIGD